MRRWYQWPFFRVAYVEPDPLPVALPAGDLEVRLAFPSPAFWCPHPTAGQSIMVPESTVTRVVSTVAGVHAISWPGCPAGALIQSIRANGVEFLAAPLPSEVFGPSRVLERRRWWAWIPEFLFWGRT